MDEKKKQLKKILKKAKFEQNPDMGNFEELQEQNEHLETIKDVVSKPLSVVTDKPLEVKVTELPGDMSQKIESGATAADFISGFLKSIKGDKGDTPVKGKDYFTETEIESFKKEVTPIKGKDYVDGKDGEDAVVDYKKIIEEVLPLIPKPKVQKGKDGYTPVKGKDYFDGKDGKDATEIDINIVAKAAVTAIKNLKGDDRIDISSIRNAPIWNQGKKKSVYDANGGFNMDDQRWHGGGGGGGGGGTVTNFSFTDANGISGVVTNPTTTPDLTLSLGAITPTSVTASGLITTQTGLVLEETGAGTDTITIQAPASIAASYTLTLPTDDGSSGQVLSTNGTGTLSWIDATLAIGGTITGGTQYAVLFIDPANTLAQDPTNFRFTNTVNQLAVGPATILEASAVNPLVIGGNTNSYLATYIQNLSAGNSASTDITAGNDIDNGTITTGHYVDWGINSSTYNDANFAALGGANGGYGYTDGGHMSLGTGEPSSTLRFFVGGYTSAAVQMVFSASNMVYTPGSATNLTASTEYFTENWNLANQTLQFATGAKTLQRAIIVQPPTYTAVGATTITTSILMHLVGIPTAGTNITQTNSTVLMITTNSSITPAGTADLFVTGTGGTRAFATFRTQGAAAHTFTQQIYEMDLSNSVTLITRFIRTNSATVGIVIGRGRNPAGTIANDTINPSTAVNLAHTTVLSSFTPSASSPSYAALQINPTINGTSTGTATGLAIASVTNTLTGGTVRLVDIGTSTTDYFTGFTSLFSMSTTLLQSSLQTLWTGTPHRYATASFLYFGASTTSADFAILGAGSQTNDVTAMFAVGTATRTILVVVGGATAFDYQHAVQSHPTIFMHSSNSSTTEWGSLQFDATNFVITTGAGGVSVPRRLLTAKGADVASAGTITLGFDGNQFDITGTTTINYITTTGWTSGSVIYLQFDGILTFTNNAGSVPANTAPVLFTTGANLTTAAGTTIILVYDATSAVWRQY